MEVLIPQRIFDDDLAARIGLVRGLEYVLDAHLVHDVAVVVRKTPLSARRIAQLAGAGRKQEVINHHHVKDAGRPFEDFRHLLPGLRRGIAAHVHSAHVGTARQPRRGHAAVHKEALLLK